MSLLNRGQCQTGEGSKKRGLAGHSRGVSASFYNDDRDITEDHGNFKMNPPLRGKSDVEALKAGLKEDIMDVIATDHAPHSEEEKNKSMKEAMFGIVGLETMASLTYTELVDTGVLTPMQMAEKTSYYPAKDFRLAGQGSSFGRKDCGSRDFRSEQRIHN